jgi:hypothetical protein
MFRRLLDFIGQFWRRGLDAEEEQRLAALSEEVQRLSMEEAVEEALRALANRDWFEVEENSCLASNEVTAQLPPSIRSLFNKFKAIRFEYGEMMVGVDFLQFSEIGDRLIRIGTDIGFTEIVVKPQSDEIMIVDAPAYAVNDFETFPSLQHYICMLGRMKEMDLEP